AQRPVARSTALALPNVKITSPRRTSSRLASRTSARNASSTAPSSYVGSDAAQLRQCGAAAKFKIQLAVDRVEIFAAFLRLDHVEAGAEAVLRLFDRVECARGHEREDRRAEAGDIAVRYQDRLAHHVRVP